jgi:hypothetical protein
MFGLCGDSFCALILICVCDRRLFFLCVARDMVLPWALISEGAEALVLGAMNGHLFPIHH